LTKCNIFVDNGKHRFWQQLYNSNHILGNLEKQPDIPNDQSVVDFIFSDTCINRLQKYILPDGGHWG
jgi:hypothetical protein